MLNRSRGSKEIYARGSGAKFETPKKRTNIEISTNHKKYPSRMQMSFDLNFVEENETSDDMAVEDSM